MNIPIYQKYPNIPKVAPHTEIVIWSTNKTGGQGKRILFIFLKQHYDNDDDDDEDDDDNVDSNYKSKLRIFMVT